MPSLQPTPHHKDQRSPYLLLALILLLGITACTAPAVNVQQPPHVEEPAGFWLGLWHGIIIPVTFVISLFKDSMAIYAVYNTGGWYDFGFILGAGAYGFLGSASRTKR